MLDEQLEIYYKLADTYLEGLKREEFKRELRAEANKASVENAIDAKSLWGKISDKLQELETSLTKARNTLNELKTLNKPLVYATPLNFSLVISNYAQRESEIEAIDKILELLDEVQELEASIFYNEED